MIRISCTNCKTVLSIDDAFAGGVCRCQHCGTIQTVPSSARDAEGSSVGGQSMGGSRALSSGDGTASGLNDLANIVASSGLTGSGLGSRRLKATTTAKPAAKKAKSQMPLFIGLGVLIAALIGVIVWLAMRPGASGSAAPQSQTPSTVGSPAPVAVPTKPKPNFAGIPLDAPTVVYLLDRGSATQGMFGALEEAAIKSASTLGTDRKFAIVFWNNGSASSYPDDATTFATPDNVKAANDAIQNVAAYGASDAVPALKQAIALSPDVILIATAKGWDLDDSWVKSMMAARGSSTVKIDCVNLGSAGSGNALKDLADKTGGKFEDLSSTDLANFGS